MTKEWWWGGRHGDRFIHTHPPMQQLSPYRNISEADFLTYQENAQIKREIRMECKCSRKSLRRKNEFSARF